MNIISKEFILSLSKIVTEDGCWLVVGKHSSGQVFRHGRPFLLHRIVAYLWHGGFDIFKKGDACICHTCKNDSMKKSICISPEHLYVGSDSSNKFDSARNKTHINSRKTHCPRGHLYNDVQRRYGKIISRRCSICRVISAKKSRVKARQAKVGG